MNTTSTNTTPNKGICRNRSETFPLQTSNSISPTSPSPKVVEFHYKLSIYFLQKHNDKKESMLTLDSHAEREVQRLTKLLANKENMLQTSAMLGNQLVAENDKLQSQIDELTNEISSKDEKLLAKEREIVIMSDRIAQLESETDTLHNNMVNANQEIEKLKDDLLILEKINSHPKNSTILEGNDIQTIKTELERVMHAKQVLEQAFKDGRFDFIYIFMHVYS